MISCLWTMGIRACIPIVFALTARMALRRYPCVWRYALWMLVLCRLLCPVFIESSNALPVDLRQFWDVAGDAGQTGDAAGQTVENGREATQAGLDGGAEEAGVPGTKAAARTDVVSLLRWGYLLGMLAVAGVFAAQYARVRRRTAFAVRDAGNVWLCEGIGSPFVMGIFRPRIYLPYGLAGEEREYAVMHERMHIRHLDPLWRLAGLLAVCLYWWNPFVWCAYYAACEDMELYCDESVLKDKELTEKKAYANALLRLSARQSGLAVLPAFGQSHTEKRVRSIFVQKESRAEAQFAAWFFLMLLMGVCVNLMVTVPRASGNALDMSGYGEEDMPVALTEAVLGEASVTSDGNDYRIQLVMTEGEYFSEEYAGAGGGIYEENFQGAYELRALRRNGDIVFRLQVADEDGGERFNFGGRFELAAADYNADGCADFTLGIWGSSSMGIYYLYTVYGDGQITLAYPHGIEDAGLDFSRVFEQTEDGFAVQSYNNATGEYSRITYDWDGTQYVRREH